MNMYSIFLFLLLCAVNADVYMHSPRGSNNRYTNNNGQVQNNDRLCNTQNNNKGGYDFGGKKPLSYTSGSILSVEWTSQHGCTKDVNGKAHCMFIFQYMCGELVRDGNSDERIENTPAGSLDTSRGMHENYDYYQNCTSRERNQGLFIADRTLNGNTAQYTRQNENGNRRGYECPEERDYYPYWHPTPWKDIAIFTNDPSRCEYYQTESQNVKNKGICFPSTEFNRKGSSADDGCPPSEWYEEGAWNIDPPACYPAPFNRVNHLGNKEDGQMNILNWTIPELPNGEDQNCVLRLRYNMSTIDYDGWSTDAKFNGKENSPIGQDDLVEYGWDGNYLELALNTNQYGRTFQDRSHTFKIIEKPESANNCSKIYNVGVRGKRGNYVQVYPAVEYDFTPTRLDINEGDCVHFQWTGSDQNPANYEGRGTSQTDRSNICQISTLKDNICMNMSDVTMFEDEATIERFAHLSDSDEKVVCLDLPGLLTIERNTGEKIEENDNNCALLNNIKDPYYDGGIIPFKKAGVYHYMSSRNNFFGKRSQKATIVVNSVSE